MTNSNTIYIWIDESGTPNIDAVEDDFAVGMLISGKKVNVDTIDSRFKLRKAIDCGFLLTPVKLVNPIVSEFLHIIEICAVFPASIVRHFVPGVGCNFFADGVQRFVRNGNLKGLAFGHVIEDINCKSNSNLKLPLRSGDIAE